MPRLLVKAISSLRGSIHLSGDKSISHRAVILSSLSHGKTRIDNFLFCEDTVRTLKAFKEMGIKIKEFKRRNSITIYGKGLYGLKEPKKSLNLGYSATSFRLLAWILAGQKFRTKLTALPSLSLRPMSRITIPLRLMGANIKSKIPARGRFTFGEKIQKSKILEEYPPLTIRGGNLKSITYRMPIASAQVKSAILLAGLYADGKTKVSEIVKTRDHTERMLKIFDAKIKTKGLITQLKGKKELISPKRIFIPGDISSASFFIVAATILPNSELLLKSVSLNPTRLGLIRVLKRMGAKINIKYQISKIKYYEPVGDILVRSSQLKGTTVNEKEIPTLIDELPILMVVSCFAKGTTKILGIEELRVKETDRINSMVTNLKKMGANIKIKNKKRITIIIKGVRQLKGIEVDSFSDHRTAMSMIIAGLASKGETKVLDVDCIKKSFPLFLKELNHIIRPSNKKHLTPI